MTTWSPNLAYAIGLITTDGNLSKDGRHIELTSKDKDQIETFRRILGLKNKIGLKYGSYSQGNVYYHVQFGDRSFYGFLLDLGLMPNKTKHIKNLSIPDRYLPDFLRGYLDGDGYTYSYWDPRWKSSFMFYLGFVSASKEHLDWLRNTIVRLYGIEGKINFVGKSTYRLIFAKKSAVVLVRLIYYKAGLPCLLRKRLKIEQALGIIDKTAGMLKLADRPD